MVTNDEILHALNGFEQRMISFEQRMISFEQRTSSDIEWLKEQTRANCSKINIIDERTELLPKMYEMVEASGQNIENSALRINKLEDRR